MKKPKRTTASPSARPRPAPPRKLTPELCNHLRRGLLTACRRLAETHGLTVEGGNLSDVKLRHGFDFRFRASIPMPDGSLFLHDKVLFNVLAPSFGLEPSDHARISEPAAKPSALPQSIRTVPNTQSAQTGSPTGAASNSPPTMSLLV